MKILLLHNTYQQRGGEDVMVDAEAEMLRAGGHDVQVECVSNDDIVGVKDKARVFMRSSYDPARANWTANLVKSHGAEVVHVHNFWPLLTPAVHRGAAQAGAAVVQTLHNFRLLCSGGTFLRNGTVCEKCLNGTPAWGVIHRCYRGSVPGSLAVAAMQVRARQQGVWQKDVHRFIALTDFARAKFIEGGLPPDRIVVKPNALTASVLPIINQRIGVLFVGRLSLEKGVSTLVEAAKLVPNLSVTIVGDGPDRDSLEATASPNVKFLGAVSGKKVRELMAVAQALVMPSIWYEGFPVTLLEAFSSRLPIIASRIGSLESLISHKDTGLHFEAANTNQLSEHLKLLVEHPEIYTKMGENAYTEFKTHYTVKPNRELLENIYRDAIITAENRGF